MNQIISILLFDLTPFEFLKIEDSSPPPHVPARMNRSDGERPARMTRSDGGGGDPDSWRATGVRLLYVDRQ